MKAGRRHVSLLLVAVVFASAVCAQACIDPAPTPDCPAEHQTKDCCKHEGSKAGRVTITALSDHNLSKSPIAWPAEVTLSATELHKPELTYLEASRLSHPPQNSPAPLTLTLRI